MGHSIKVRWRREGVEVTAKFREETGGQAGQAAVGDFASVLRGVFGLSGFTRIGLR